MNKKIILVDTTLRDGLQSPGIEATVEDRIQITGLLDSLGIDEIEIGIPAMGEQECSCIRKCARRCSAALVSVWCRGREDDLYTAARCEVPAIHLSFPASPAHHRLIGTDKQVLLDSVRSLVEKASKLFNSVRVGAQDATRADLDFLSQLFETARDAGATRARIADTVGLAAPCQVAELMRRTSRAGIPIEFHGHNDLGMATANSLTAVEHGAAALSCTLLGIGERAGNTALEQIAMALTMHGDYQTGIITQHLHNTAQAVAKKLSFGIAPDKPIVGSRVFTHESGIHCHGMLKDPSSFQPFDAALVGSKTRFVVGSHSGGASVRAVFEQHGIHLSKAQARSILPALRDHKDSQRAA